MAAVLTLVVLLVIVTAVVILFGVAGWAAIFGGSRDERRRAEHEANADLVLDGLFDGSPAVTYVAPDTSGGLSIETLVAGAADRGYRLVSESGRMAARRVVFERRES